MPVLSEDNNAAPRIPGSRYATTLLIALLAAELAGMSWYTYVDVKRRSEPAMLVDEVEKAIRTKYPEVRRTIEEDFKHNAPDIAEKLSDELVASGPAIRQWIERTTARQLEYGLDEATGLSAEQFQAFVQDNHDQIEQAFERLQDAPEETRRLVLELEDRLDETLGVDVRVQARNALRLHRRLNAKLERLGGDAPLEPKELLERRIIRILRTLEAERLPELPQAPEG